LAFVAGIVAHSNGEIINCINEGKITNNATTNTSSGYAYTAGIVGGSFTNTATIKDCRNTAEIVSSASGASVLSGGIAGYNDTNNIENSYNTGNISASGTATSLNSTGGISGQNNGQIKICTNTGNITNTGTALYVYVAGIAGQNGGGSSLIINSINEGKITNRGRQSDNVERYGLRAAGVTANNQGNVANCYNKTAIECSGTGYSTIGGIIAHNEKDGKVNLCYNTGSLSNTATKTKRTGAISGGNYAAITNCYYLSGTASAGIGSGTTTGTTSMSDANMKLESFVNTLNGLRQTGYLEWTKGKNYPVFKKE